MEKRGQEIRDIGISSFMGFNQESQVKLPLAPIVSTPSHRRANPATVSIHRGSSIFSPTQTLDHHHQPPPPPPPPLPPPPVQDHDSTQFPPPDPASSPGGASNPPPPLLPVVMAAAAAEPNGQESEIRYRECLKNHAAKKGGHVVDGCGEFMPSGAEGTQEFLRCAACDCHRNFHRKEVQGTTNTHRTPFPNTQSPPPQKHLHTQPVMVTFGGGAAADHSSSEDLNMYDSGGVGGGGNAVSQASKKRFRTKFSEEQKDKMQEMAVKIGWRIQKQDEEEVQRFCKETGVKREVFKVWLHNNKQAMKKRQIF